MTQYVRPAQAFAAVSAYVAYNASPEATDLRDFMFRASQKVTIGKGLDRYGSVLQLNTNERYLAIPDDVYAALVTAGVDFSDTRYNSSTSPGATASTSEVPTMTNRGLHRLALIVIGSSIPNGSIGSGTFKEFALLKNRWWAQGVDAGGKGAVYVAPVTLPNTAPGAPEYAYSKLAIHAESVIAYNFGRDSGRIANQGAGFSYQTPTPLSGSPHLDNVKQFANLMRYSSQRRIYDLRSSLTNDGEYALRNSNPGLGSTPSGGTWSGSPNMVTDCIVPFITTIKAADPGAEFRLWSELPRTSNVNTTRLNQTFNEFFVYALANRATLGINLFVDLRQNPRTDCRTPSVAASSDFQDGVHPAPVLVEEVLGPAVVQANKFALGFAVDPAFSAMMS